MQNSFWRILSLFWPKIVCFRVTDIHFDNIIFSHRSLNVGLKRLKIHKNEAKGLVHKSFEEKLMKDNILLPHASVSI